MPTLAEMSSAAPPDATGNVRDDYIAYAEACAEAGSKALSMADWIKAGKPKGP